MLNLYIVVTYASKYATNRQEAESVAANLVSKYIVSDQAIAGHHVLLSPS